MEKNHFEKKFKQNRKIRFFQYKNYFFQVKFLLEKIDFPIEKKKKKSDFFSKSFFSVMKKYFSMRFF